MLCNPALNVLKENILDAKEDIHVGIVQQDERVVLQEAVRNVLLKRF